ncbi:MAG: PepSY-associated TM helix domain-containing protein [Candidatus Acidiferrales bacterium]
MPVRKWFFYIHLTAGSLAGIVILIMSVTGVLLAYQRQIIPWVDRNIRSVPSQPGEARLSGGALLARACAVAPSTPSGVTLHSQADQPVEVAFGRDRTVYFNSYTGDAIGVASQKTRSFFLTVEGVHRWLGVSAEHRPVARLTTGIANLAFLVLVITGVFLWWPRSGTWQGFRAAAVWRWSQPGSRARYWNWHTVTGFWCAIPLIVIVSCGVVMSFPWANDLVYRMTGNIPPPAQPALSGGSGALSASTIRQTRDRNAALDMRRREQESGEPNGGDPRISGTPAHKGDLCGGWDFRQIDTLWDRAEQRVPDWRTITLRVPANTAAPAVFTIDEGNGGRPDKRSQLTLDWHTGAALRWDLFSSYNEGRRLRSWVRFFHTGEAAGIAGQTIAALAAMGVVPTGLLMAWKRLLRQRTHTVVRRDHEVEAA